MGSAQSKEVQASAQLPQKPQKTQQYSEKAVYNKALESLDPSDRFKVENFRRWQEDFLAEPLNKLAVSAVSNVGITSVIAQPTSLIQDKVNEFSDKIELEGSPVTNQNSSGRCWIFASSNVLRVGIQKAYKIENFELSQAYLFFYDKLEKSNFFLQNIIETLDEPLDSRILSTLLGDVVSDGGQWDMIVNLVSKYGVAPKSVYPDSFNAISSSQVNYFLVNKLREYGLALRDAAKSKGLSRDQLAVLKDKFMKEVYGILVVTLGPPPKPDEKFTWEYTDKEKKFHRVEKTPVEFYESVAKFKATDYFSLINDPRNDYNTLYTVDRLGNIVGGRPIEYVNVEIDILKKAAIAAIQNNEPVFFGCDVGKFSDTKLGVMDVKGWDYAVAFGKGMEMTKAQRLKTGSSAMTHAMVLTAVNLVDGKPTKWRVENSWGDTSGVKGYLIMSDEWFNEYVYQVVTNPKYIDKKYVDIWKSKKYVVLPRWDPLGALA